MRGVGIHTAVGVGYRHFISRLAQREGPNRIAEGRRYERRIGRPNVSDGGRRVNGKHNAVALANGGIQYAVIYKRIRQREDGYHNAFGVNYPILNALIGSRDLAINAVVVLQAVRRPLGSRGFVGRTVVDIPLVRKLILVRIVGR